MTRGLTLGTAAATALATLMIAPAAQAAEVTLENPAAPSAAHGQALALDGLGLPLLGAASSTSEFGGQAGGLAGLDLSVLGQNLSLGSITLPLLKDPNDPNSEGLLAIGDVSLLRGYSAAPTKSSAVASSGVITDEGALNLADAADPDLAAAKIDLTALLSQLGLSGVTDGIVDELSLEVGALGSRVEKTDSKVASEYTLAGVEANVGAPLVGGLTTGLDGVVSTLGGTLNGLVGKDGVVGGVLGLLEKILNIDLLVASLKSDGVRAEVNGLDTLVDDVLEELVRTPLSNSTGSVYVNLAEGTVSLDLAELAIEGNGYTNLNKLPANTNLINSKTLTAVTNGLTEALLGTANPESLMSKLTAILTDHLWNDVSIDIFIDAKVKLLLGLVPVADTTIQLTGSLAEFAGYNGAKLKNENVKFELDLLGIVPLGDLIEPIVKPLLNTVGSIAGPLLTTVTKDVIGQLQPLLSGVISGLLTPVLDTLNPVLTGVATVTVNDQPAVGDLGAGSTTVNAVAVELLPGLLGTNAVSLELGNSSVKAAAAVAELSVSPSSVKPGEKVTIKGAGYGAGENVTIASALGATKTVKANAQGAFTADWTVPAAQKAGSVKFTATGVDSKRTASASVTVTATSTGANASSNTSGTATSAANTNASASAAAAADGQATAAAKAAAQANASTGASAKATASAQAAAKAAATTNASTNASTNTTASAAASAQAAANSKASSDSNAKASASANSNASAAAKAAASANASTNASSSASANGASSNASSNGANVNASASASADSKANAAAKAAANADASTSASAKATATAQAAAKAAANPTASTNATAKANAASKAAAQAAAKAKSDSDSNAKASAAAKGNAAAAAKAAAISNASTNASGNNPNPNTLKCLEPGKKQVFLDTPSSHKFYTEIDWMYCMKYTTGIKSDAGLIYGPQMRLSREAMAAFIFRMEAPKSYKAPKVSPFADMKPGDKFYREIAWMHEAGLSTGIKQASGKPFYAPKERLSREAMAAFIYRLEAPKGYYAPAKSKMADMKPGQKFYTEINWMVEEGLSTGIKVEGGNREYWPKARLSREAMAAFIYRLAHEYRA